MESDFPPASDSTQEAIEEKAEKKEESSEKISTVITLGIQTLQILMACLLVIFVPQNCPTPDVGGCPSPPHACSVSETLQGLGPLPIVAVLVNFLTFFLSLWHEWAVWTRESWMIMHFHFDDDKYSEDNLKKTLDLYEVLSYEYMRHNWHTMVIACICMGFHAVNIILSAVVVFAAGRWSSHTVTTYLTYVLLVVGVFKGVMSNAWVGIKKGKGLSNMKLTPYEWNMVRPEHAPRGQGEDQGKHS